jgi:transcriptional regulator with XRE-family HTH domain
LLNFSQMEAQKATAAPGRFIRTLKDAMDGNGLSLRQLADKAGVSPAYLSRLFNKERGLPTDETIAKFEEVLDIRPRGALFDAAGRHDGVAAKFVQKDGARLLMRTLGPLTEAEMAQVQKVAQRLASQHAKETT